jgi:hypothetical protein
MDRGTAKLPKTILACQDGDDARRLAAVQQQIPRLQTVRRVNQPLQRRDDVCELREEDTGRFSSHGGNVGWWVLWLAGWTQAASAQTYYLESEFTTTRDPATEVARIASEAGIPGRVVRLYVQEQGWRYLFRSEERPDDVELLSELGELRAKSAVGLRLMRVQDGRTEIMGDEAAVPAAAVPSVKSFL